MTSTKLIIVDVGHGNSAVLLDSNGATIIDCAPGPTVLDTLEHFSVTDIASIIVSHGDFDHLGGLTGLLNDARLNIQNVFINHDSEKADSQKGTHIWQALIASIRDARMRSGVRIHNLTVEHSGTIDSENVKIEVLAPVPELTLCNVGESDPKGRPITSNSLSAVIRLIYNSKPLVLFTGDLDGTGFANLIEEGSDIQADVLVFPHHGGRLGVTDIRAFSRRLCELVNPQLVLFSIGRGVNNTPQPEVVEGIREAVPRAHILCTQLSIRCATSTPTSSFSHLVDLPSKGKNKSNCCGGTVLIEMSGKNVIYSPFEPHKEFVRSQVPAGLCIK